MTSSSNPTAAIAPPAVRITSGRCVSMPMAMPIACSVTVAAMNPTP